MVGTKSIKALGLKDIVLEKEEKITTGFNEFDRVLGGGITKGGLYLIGGEPGVGKSTLITSVLDNLIKIHNKKSLYISGEESINQVASRAKRLDVDPSNFLILNESSIQSIIEQIQLVRPRFVVLDSIQTTTSDEVVSPAGSVSQIRDVTYELMSKVKEKGVSCFIVGHITKEGSIAGPKVLEHMVDTVIYFEGDQSNQYRILRSVKNRFGSTNEIGIFEINGKGMREALNPMSIFLNRSEENLFGSSLACVVQGQRPLILDVQALIVENQFGNGKRISQGVESSRIVMILAIIKKYLFIDLSMSDVYLNISGGLRLSGGDMDLSILISILSSYKCKSIYSNHVILGEISLTGEIRPIGKLESRLRELKHLGFNNILTSKKALKETEELSLDMNIKTVSNVKDFNGFL